MKLDLPQILKQSLINCHAIGLDSVVLEKTDEKLVRVFYTNEFHELWKNNIPLTENMSLGFHSHHCDIKLIPIFGNIFNILESKNGIQLDLKEYRYQSKITTGSAGFVSTEKEKRLFFKSNRLIDPVSMAAAEMHTVYVPKNELAAWFVYEGDKDPNYTPLTYSNYDLGQFDFSPLYRPMNMNQLVKILNATKIFNKNI